MGRFAWFELWGIVLTQFYNRLDNSTGADVITSPPKVFQQLIEYSMTDTGLAAFLADWERTGQQLR
jgi:transaldolase